MHDSNVVVGGLDATVPAQIARQRGGFEGLKGASQSARARQRRVKSFDYKSAKN